MQGALCTVSVFFIYLSLIRAGVSMHPPAYGPALDYWRKECAYCFFYAPSNTLLPLSTSVIGLYSNVINCYKKRPYFVCCKHVCVCVSVSWLLTALVKITISNWSRREQSCHNWRCEHTDVTVISLRDENVQCHISAGWLKHHRPDAHGAEQHPMYC